MSCLAANYTAAASSSSANVFLSLMQTLLVSQYNLGSNDNYPPDYSEHITENNNKFDFVIVGGGSAGSVLANRLTEIKNWRVLLIEAGENPSILSEMPAGFAMQLQTPEDYSYDVEYERFACQAMKKKTCKWPRGKALGGSSTLNAMLYVHGNEKDYNDWFRMGNKGWSYDKVLPYLRKSVTCGHVHSDKWRRKYCGHGPLNIRYYNYTHAELLQLYLDAAREMGVPILDVINGEKHIGYGLAQGTIDKGHRNSASKAFLSPIKNRRNLYVMKSTRADAILLDGTRATGVRVTLKNGTSMDVKASKEVILSAGSIGSPQLLMLSGIGPKQHLKQKGISCVVDLPVGKNLQDHVNWVGLLMTYKNENAKPPSPTYMLDNTYKYLVYNQGPLSTSVGYDLMGIINVNNPNSKYPDIQINHFHLPQWYINETQLYFTQIFNVEEQVQQEIMKIQKDNDIIIPAPNLLNPKSTGEILLRSKNPADPVIIYANYYSESEDLETMLKTVNFIKKMVNTETMKRKQMRLAHLDIAGCRHTKPDSEEYWKCNIQHLSSTLFHPVGTAKMGPQGDSTAVVDPRLKVHGMQGLRIIDGSIMPKITSGNINAPILMIAEKGADLIKIDWLAK